MMWLGRLGPLAFDDVFFSQAQLVGLCLLGSVVSSRVRGSACVSSGLALVDLAWVFLRPVWVALLPCEADSEGRVFLPEFKA